MVEKVRIGDYGPNSITHINSAQKNSVENTEEFSHSPQQMRPQFQMPMDTNDHTPPTTGLSQNKENENSRKNTMNHK